MNGTSTIIAKGGGIGVYVQNTAPSFITTSITVQMELLKQLLIQLNIYRGLL